MGRGAEGRVWEERETKEGREGKEKGGACVGGRERGREREREREEDDIIRIGGHPRWLHPELLPNDRSP